MSQVEDVAIDLPDAQVGIQLGFLGGSRRQETQRIGRIIRPKQAHNVAYFYSLVSGGANEERFSNRRREFIQAQGYNYATYRMSDILQVTGDVYSISEQENIYRLFTDKDCAFN